MLILHAAVVFVSAALLFLVQPMVGRMLLPSFGGAPAVWTTSLVFYQAVLLLGYLAAHLAITRLSPRGQVLAYGTALLAGLAALPVAVRGGTAFATGSHPAMAILIGLAAAVGLPFLALSATGPLLQAWFARSGHRASGDPYFLYAVSNLASMLALVSYPFLLEPRMGLMAQSRLWSWGFVLLAVLAIPCARVASRSGAGAPVAPSGEPARPIATAERLRWLGQAFLPSSLLMGVTLYISSDLAPIPLLWIAPLVLYLLAFILAFSRLAPTVQRLFAPLAAASGLLVVFLFFSGFRWPTVVVLSAHLAGLFFLSLFYLGDLAARRPPAAQLTEFYLWISAGGVLGGIFNALVAPLVFDRVAEYPLVLLVSLALMPVLRPAPAGVPTSGRSHLLLEAGLAVGVAALSFWLVHRVAFASLDLSPLARLVGYPRWRMTTLLSYSVPLLACAALLATRRRLAFGLALAGFAAVCVADDATTGDRVVRRTRSFFSVLSVEDDPGSECRTLRNGTTPHGRQSLKKDERWFPLSFYHRRSPIGDVMLEFRGDTKKPHVAVVGLGIGTLAAYGETGQRFTFYEIDDAVVRIARDSGLFTYLADSDAQVDIVLGDARLRLREARPGAYGLIAVDAFSSDSIPIHLLNREALALYLEKLAPDGVIALHISNRYLRLQPVVARLAADAGLVARVQTWIGRDGCSPVSTNWALLARKEADLGALAQSPLWERLESAPATPAWSDDFSDVVAAVDWRNPW